MKPAQLLLPAATCILGLLLGLALAPALRTPGGENIATTDAGFPESSKPSDPGLDDAKTNSRARARERVEDKKPKEPRVSIPLKTVVETLRSKLGGSFSVFNHIEGTSLNESLDLLGATQSEKENLKQLLQKSSKELFAAEKNRLKLGEVTVGKIGIDMSGMRSSAEENTGRTKDGIRSILPADLAHALITGIDWNEYYPTVCLELTRSRNGKLMVWEKLPSFSSGGPISNEFKDDGTPMPADQIFDDRWKPLLKGVTILPKDEE